jgi:hypothetical protein
MVGGRYCGRFPPAFFRNLDMSARPRAIIEMYLDDRRERSKREADCPGHFTARMTQE